MEELRELAAKITDGTATDEELFHYNRLCRAFEDAGVPVPGEEAAGRSILGHLRERVSPVRKMKRRRWIGWAAAILAVAVGVWYVYPGNEPRDVAAAAEIRPVTPEVLPAADKATLTLADGSVVALDSSAVNDLATLGNVRVENQNGVLTYRYDEAMLPEPGTGPAPENIVATPRGGKYQLVLPDGTRVWLNASSSIHFPVFFSGREARKVTVSGEAYFEVAKAATPFLVQTGDYEIEVLGTHFNVNIYEDEPVHATTLLEGSVKVNFLKGSYTMKPGQQTRTWKKKYVTVVSNVNTDEVIAWKNGRFQFNEADFKNIMRQLARWYDVEVKYEGTIQEKKYTVDLSRNTPLSNLLEVLKENGTKVELEGKVLTVRN